MKCICNNVPNILVAMLLGLVRKMNVIEVVSFMVVGLKENISCVVKAIPIVKLNSDWLKSEILNLIEFLTKNSFNVRGVVCDNHASNVSSFTKLVATHGEKKERLIY